MEYNDGADYLKKHGIDHDFAEMVFGLKYGAKGVSFDLRDSEGNLLGKKTRFMSGDKKYNIPEGLEAGRHLFNASGIKNEDWVVYCEGEMDCIKLTQEGVPAVTSMAGVGTVPKDIEVLRGKSVFVCLDSDKAGNDAVKKTVLAIEEVASDVRVINLPPETKDVCDYFASGKTVDDFAELKDRAYEIDPLEIVKLDDFVKIEYPKAKWLIKNLLRVDGLNMVIGQSGVGKSLLCLSMIKAVATGTDWLKSEFKTEKKRVLIVDKENSGIDLQNNIKDMGVTGDIRIFTSAELFDFVDNKLVLTPSALKLRRYVQNNQIDVILLDSMIDFYVGSEDSSTDFNFNHQTWKQVFGDKCILTIHHENKQPVKGKRSAKDRARGSSNIVAQANSIISISNDESKPELITVEHTKVRGAKKHQMFQIEMMTHNEYITNRSMVTGFEWKGNIDIKKLAADRASDAVLEFLAKAPDKYFKASDITEVICSESLGEDAIALKTAGTAIAKMREKGQIDSSGKGGVKDPYTYKYPKTLIDKMLSEV